MKRILVPVDFSEVSIKALNTAYTLAKKVKSEILVIHVVEHPTDDSFNTMGVVDYSNNDNFFLTKLIESTKEKMEELVSRPKYADIVLRYKIEIGHPFLKISEIIASEKTSIVIQGSTGATGLAGLILGSNADKVIKHATCPVITVKEEADLTNIKSIVYPTDMRGEQDVIIESIKELRGFYDAHLHLVKAYDSEWLTQKEVEDRLEVFAKKNNLQDYSVTAVKESDEVDATLEFAKELNADLIVIGTHRGRGIDSLLHGFISKRLVNRSPIPIWTKAMN
jgi:nucleotide-binding universal stress UspA family protein